MLNLINVGDWNEEGIINELEMWAFIILVIVVEVICIVIKLYCRSIFC